MKLLSILSIPYLLPIDITIVLFTKIYERLPDIKRELKDSILRFVSFLRSLLVKMESNRYFYSAKFSCQLAVKEFDYSKEETLKARKPSNATLSRKKSLQHKVSKVEKSNSFSGRKNSEYRPMFGSEMKSMESVLVNTEPQTLQSSKGDSKERFRKTSYAGREFSSKPLRQFNRRRSMIEIGNDKGTPLSHTPERVISQLNFDFKLDMKNSKSDLNSVSQNSLSDKSSDGKVLDIDLTDIDQSNAIEIANKALDWEKEFLDKCQSFKHSDENFEKMFEITRNQDAVMAYYYKDENNKVKFTELFNITDADLKGDKGGERNIDHHQDTYNDSDDGLIETQLIPPHGASVKSSLSSLHSAPPSPSLNENKSSSKRQRKKSVLVD